MHSIFRGPSLWNLSPTFISILRNTQMENSDGLPSLGSINSHIQKHCLLIPSSVFLMLFSHVWSLQPHDCSTPGFPVHHQLPELAQTHVHWVGDAIQPSCPLVTPSPPALGLSQHQGISRRFLEFTCWLLCPCYRERDAKTPEVFFSF